MIVSFTSILLVGVIGGLVPLVKRWTDRGHHAALAFSTGIFLGAVFLHLLPAVGEAAATPRTWWAPDRRRTRITITRSHDHAHEEHAGHDHGSHDHSAHDHESHDDHRFTSAIPTDRSGRGSGSSSASWASSSSRRS